MDNRKVRFVNHNYYSLWCISIHFHIIKTTGLYLKTPYKTQPENHNTKKLRKQS